MEYPDMTDEQKAGVLLCLTNIAANGPHRGDGICANVADDVGGVSCCHLAPYFKRWSEFSGNPGYPVDGRDGYANTKGSRWDVNTESGAKRYRLLAFLVHELTKELHPCQS